MSATGIQAEIDPFERISGRYNIPWELTREVPAARVTALQRADQRLMFPSVRTIGEICKGIASLPASRKRVALQGWLDLDVRAWFGGRILPVSEEIAELWKLAASAKQRGAPRAVVDGIIAATAFHHQLTLLTRNVKDFSHLGIDVLNP